MFEHCLLIHLQLYPVIDEVNQINTQFKKLNFKDLFYFSYIKNLNNGVKNLMKLLIFILQKKTHDLEN
jgi:hypothetical protein